MFLSRLFNLANQGQEVTSRINEELGRIGLPPAITGLTLNPAYRVTPPPRFVFTWRGLRLEEVYLTHLPTGRKLAIKIPH